MTAVAYKVYVVVDRQFGDRLAGLERGVPVWIVDTPTNKPVAQQLWKERPDTGITTFDDMKYAPEDMLLAELYMIELHHGSQSSDPPYTALEVIGTPLTLKAKNGFSEYGFNEFHAHSGGAPQDAPNRWFRPGHFSG
jgi:hypothetical protein